MTSFQWANDANPLSLTSKFILTAENRPNLKDVCTLDSIPTIDMNMNDDSLVDSITKACEVFGFFQVINHGIPTELCNNMLNVITRFFQLPYEEKAHLVTSVPLEDGKIYRYYIKDQETNEKISAWSETFFHAWHPTDDSFTQNLPQSTHYRELMVAYAKEVGSLITRLLSLMSQGLGLKSDGLEKILGEYPRYTAQANYYPTCPNPELTIGLRPHTDYNMLTVVLQEPGVTGLHVHKDGKWIPVDPIPGALVINLGDQMQVLSNDRYKSVYHRAVTNGKKKRVSLAMFCGPNRDSVIGPIVDLADAHNPPLYHSYTFGEFEQQFRNLEGKSKRVMEAFRIK